MGILYSDVLNGGMVDSDVMEYIPRYCNEMEYGCDSELEFTDTLNELYCPNPRCKLKIAARMEEMAKALNVKGFGIATCRKLCTTYSMQSPYQIMVLSRKDVVGGDIGAKLKEIGTDSNRSKELWEYVALGRIPEISNTTAQKLFSLYSSIEDAYEEYEEYGTELVAKRLGIGSADGVQANKIYDTLMQYKDELTYFQKEFKLYKPDGEQITIAITGGVPGFKSKGEYVKHLNTKYAGKYHIVARGTVSKDVDVVVGDIGSRSRKMVSAKKLVEKGEDLVIMSGKELEMYLSNR